MIPSALLLETAPQFASTRDGVYFCDWNLFRDRSANIDEVFAEVVDLPDLDRLFAILVSPATLGDSETPRSIQKDVPRCFVISSSVNGPMAQPLLFSDSGPGPQVLL